MKKIFAKKALRAMLVLSVMAVLAAAFATMTFAAGEPANPETTAAAQTSAGVGMGLLAAALSTGVAGIGAGIAVGSGAPAAIGALTEDAKTFGKSLIFVALGEGIALYGMLVSILILNKI